MVVDPLISICNRRLSDRQLDFPISVNILESHSLAKRLAGDNSFDAASCGGMSNLACIQVFKIRELLG